MAKIWLGAYLSDFSICLLCFGSFSFSSLTAYAAHGFESVLGSFKAPQVEINAVI